MDIGIISMRYAKALIAYAQEEKAEDTLYGEFKTLAHSFTVFPELRTNLDNPILTAKDKLKLISTAAVGEAEPSKAFIRFINLVLKHRRETLLQYISLSYIRLYYQIKHIAVGTLTTAVPVDDKTRERIRSTSAAIVHAEMELQTVVDSSIVGGFIFDINDFRLDASVATQLKRLKQQFIDKNKRIV